MRVLIIEGTRFAEIVFRRRVHFPVEKSFTLPGALCSAGPSSGPNTTKCVESPPSLKSIITSATSTSVAVLGEQHLGRSSSQRMSRCSSNAVNITVPFLPVEKKAGVVSGDGQ